MLHRLTPKSSIRRWRAQFPQPLSRGMVAFRAILDRRIIRVRDVDNDPEIAQSVRDLGVKSIVAIPMFREGEVIGSISINTAAGFSESQIALLQTFAEQAVIAITSAETYRALQTRTSDLQETLEYQTATSDVLKVISRSTFNLQPVLEQRGGDYGTAMRGRSGRDLSPRGWLPSIGSRLRFSI